MTQGTETHRCVWCVCLCMHDTRWFREPTMRGNCKILKMAFFQGQSGRDANV